MNFAGLLLLLFTHFLSGRGVLKLFKIVLPPAQLLCLSMAVGVPLLSLVPCILQLLSVPITLVSAGIGVVLFALLLGIPVLAQKKVMVSASISLPAYYEWVPIAVLLFFIGVSIWRCYYFPPFARDMMSGPELIAEYTVREGTMINSVFNVDLQSTNNQFKSPYITSLQILYKLLVCPFGQLWLSVVFVSFMGFLYSIVCMRIHPVIGGLLLLFFLIIPDVYSYTYIVLYDYSNMVFFFFGYYLLTLYIEAKRTNFLLLSAFMFGLAVYIRTETLVLTGVLLPLLIFSMVKSKMPVKKILTGTGLFLAIPALFYVLCIHVFVRNFVPLPFDVSGQLNPNLSDVSVFFGWLKGVGRMLFSPMMLNTYGYYIYFFCTLLLADIIFTRRVTKEAAVMLYGIAVVYIGLAFLGYLLPVVDLGNTTKRGLFKMFPLMLLYMANSSLLQQLSAFIKKIEHNMATDQVV